MVTDQTFEAFIGQADPALTEAWTEFIHEQDSRYDWLARKYGEPYAPLPEEEIYLAARLAAALGAVPPATTLTAAPTRELVGTF
jgi:hypothetical protein